MKGKRKLNDISEPIIIDSSNKISELEQRRLENMKRNEEYLVSVGLSPTVKQKASVKPPSRRNIPVAIEQAPVEGSRRSSRIVNLPTPNYKEELKPNNNRRETVEDESTEVYLGGASDLVVGTFQGLDTINFEDISHQPNPVSGGGIFASNAYANLSYLLHKYLGKSIDGFGKAAVMQLSLYYSSSSNSSQPQLPMPSLTSAAANQRPLQHQSQQLVKDEQQQNEQRKQHAINVRFNKYSGVAEWKNALYLWVNLDGSAYTNTFSGKGQYMMWYGGSTMHKESRVIKRLLASYHQYSSAVHEQADQLANLSAKQTAMMQAAEQQAAEAAEEQIILWVREPEQPYICLGRVQYVAVNIEKQPIEVKWRLLDYDHLAVNSEDFQRIVKL